MLIKKFILGDKHNKNLGEVREAFLDFLGEPKDSIRRTRPGGIYEAYDIISGKSANYNYEEDWDSLNIF